MFNVITELDKLDLNSGDMFYASYYGEGLDDETLAHYEDLFWSADEVRIGMSKVVLTFAADPVHVYKVPIMGFHDTEDPEGYDRPYEGGLKDCEHGLPGPDYCAKEMWMYDRITAQFPSVADMFVPTELVGCVNDVPVYRSPRMDCCFYARSEAAEGSRTFNKSLTYVKERYTRSVTAKRDMDAAIFDCWHDVDLYDDFVEAVRSFAVTDLHDENVMFGFDGKLRVVDMAGFSDNL